MNGIDGASKDDAVHAVELSLGIRELDDLSWAHEGEIEWVPHEHDILALIVRKLNLLEGVRIWEVDLGLKFWGWVLNSANNWLRIHFFLFLWLI